MTPTLSCPPVDETGLAGYGSRLRRRDITAEAATRAFLDRIESLDGKLGAFEHVAAEEALRTARAMDELLRARTDLGPLMGVPIAVKDLFAVDGMPTRAGSNIDVSDLIGPEGSFVKSLKRAGCVILGKTKTVEFALGATGVNSVRGTPWNPADAAVHRLPGGSSSGSAVAVAAGLAALAIGSDTGGSIRMPAAFTGVFGLKTTVGTFPTDGVFPLSPTLDSIGPLCRTAADAAIFFEALTGEKSMECHPGQLRLGRPATYFFDNLDGAVAQSIEAAFALLREAGVEIVEIDVPQARERSEIIPPLMTGELMASLGRRRFQDRRAEMDPAVANRAAFALDLSALEYLDALRRHRSLALEAATKFADLDGWVMPTIPITAPTLEAVSDPSAASRLTQIINQNTQPANVLGLCGVSLPISPISGSLPVGLQVLGPGGGDAALLGVALALEKVLRAGAGHGLCSETLVRR